MLRRKGHYNAGDVRNLVGTKQAQRAMDELLSQWAASTWNLPSIVGKDFSMRVAATLEAAEQGMPDPFQPVDPQADWKQTKGKEKRTRHHAKPDPILEQIAQIAGLLLYEDPKQYALLCLHYGALNYRDTFGWPTERKAAYLDIEVKTYLNRCSQLRKYFVEKWPKDKTLVSYKVLTKREKRVF